MLEPPTRRLSTLADLDGWLERRRPPGAPLLAALTLWASLATAGYVVDGEPDAGRMIATTAMLGVATAWRFRRRRAWDATACECLRENEAIAEGMGARHLADRLRARRRRLGK